jgi:TnpA family transposase
MKYKWGKEELDVYWSLLPEDQKLLRNKTGATRLGFAVLLKFFQQEGRSPETFIEIPQVVIQHLAHQIGVSEKVWPDYNWEGRTIKYHRAEIRKKFGFREATQKDLKSLGKWLIQNIFNQENRMDRLYDVVLKRFRTLFIEPPAAEQIRRLLRSALQEHETRFCSDIFQKFDSDILERLNALLIAQSSEDGEIEWTAWQSIKADPGKVGIDSVKQVASRLNLVRQIEIPEDLFKGVQPKLIERYAKRAVVEEPFELRRHPEALKITLLVAFLHRRSEGLTDHLVDLLVEIVHKMGKKAERRIEDGIGEMLQKATGKMVKLYKMAKASLESPKGTVEDVIFPAAPEKWLTTLIQEVEKGSGYKGKVRTSLQRSYRYHYRRMLPELLNTLEFRCTNTKHQPVMEALDLIKANLDRKGSTYQKGIQPTLKGVVPNDWMPLVVEEEGNPPRINRVAYEICVLKALRERLRCREIWVVGSRRYRDPEEDLPRDFDDRKAAYYEDLGIPIYPKAFTAAIKEEMTRHLQMLDGQISTDSKVKIIKNKKGARISISPFGPQAEPENLVNLKQEIVQRWSGTSLLDILKETDLRINFTQCLRSGTERFHMDKAILQRRLLLCLYGLGTNTGIKSMESRPHDDFKDLFYIRRRFISIEGLRQAIAQVVNATLSVRLPQIWGEATTACASDSKQFGSWDQNLLTEWHLRYGGRGVMVYWHVEKNALCIYSQLKKVSSSEATAMIQGVLRHCTEMEVDRQYVDSHGQNTVAFAFCRLLGFELMPRLKGIGRQKLFKVETGQSFSNLDPVMSLRAINWESIEEQLDTMVKHAAALKLGMADAESLLRCFTRNNAQHPAYKALTELGKAIKTIFLCRYLASEELRREINEGLNVVESWNSTNGFIFYGKGAELATNRQENQEVGLLCLHLLQASLVYINTLMIQQVLGDPHWMKQMTNRDLAAMSPLLTLHINPYGRFELDLEARLPIEEALAA